MNLRYYNNTHIDDNNNNYCINIKYLNYSIMPSLLLLIFIMIINKLYKKYF